MAVMTQPEHTQQRLKEWGRRLDRENPGGLGPTLLAYLERWCADKEELLQILEYAHQEIYACRRQLDGEEAAPHDPTLVDIEMALNKHRENNNECS